MKKETADEIVGRALRGEPYAPAGEDADDVTAQPSAVESNTAYALPDFDAVEQHIYGACRRYITQDMLEPIHNLIREAIDADRASCGRSPAGAAREPTAFIHWPINGPPRLVWYSQKALNDAILKTYEVHQPDVKLYTAQAAPAAGAVAGPTDAQIDACARSMLNQPWGIGSRIEDARAFGKRILSKFGAVAPTPAAGAVAGPVLFVSHEQLEGLLSKPDPEGEHGRYLPIRHVSAGKFTHPLYAAPTPAAQADSGVQEDAARLDWLDTDGGKCVFHLGDTWYTRPSFGLPYRRRANLRAAIDAARKQGEKP